MSQSTADRFIDLMAAIRLIEENNNEPMRHAIRRLKSNATGILDNAINEAWCMVEVARQLSKDCADAVAEEAARAKEAS